MIRRRFSNTGSTTYMTIEAIEDTEVTLPRRSWYSTDGYIWYNDTRHITLNKGQLLSIKDNVNALYGQIIINGRCNLLGNCMSLIYGDNFRNYLEVPQDAFYETFMNNVGIEKVSKGFLPAIILASNCYQSMFEGCTSLTTAPELPATTLASYCYSRMFNGCTSLTTAPELPATTLVDHCYDSMFSYCTSLTTAPELPATTLVGHCYSWMFWYCTKLNYIKMLATDISVSNCLRQWVYGVASSGRFVKNPAMTTLPTGDSGIPSGWTVVNDGEE